MVVATATPKRNGPTKWATALIDKALRGDMARDEIMVATMLLESWKPFRKSNVSAMVMITISREGISRSHAPRRKSPENKRENTRALPST
jgi:hypothetical protein